MAGKPRKGRRDVTPLRRDSHVALYIQIADHLKQEILSGAYQASGRLPSEQSLTGRYGVSRVTVRLAIGHLLNEGLVVRKQGKGTFIAGSHVRHDLKDLRGIYDVLVSQGLEPETTLLKFEPALPPPEVADALGAGKSRRVFLKRLYRLDGAAIALAQTWLPLEAQTVSWADAETHPSYSILQQLLAMPVASADISIRGQLAGGELARALKLKAASPILLLERRSYGPAGEPREFTRFAVNSETYEFTLNAASPQALSTGLRMSAIAS
jgi:GntR family transcriptional regulator